MITNEVSYGADTVALLAYFVEALGFESNKIFQAAEELKAELVIPEIVIGETIYTIDRGNEIFEKIISIDVQDTILTILFQSPMYRIVPFNLIG